MHAGAGLGDDALLAHALGQEDLADAVVDLVRAGMVQLFALEINLCATEMFSQTLGIIERARTADIMGAEIGQFLLEFRIVLRLFPFGLKIQDQRHQRFRDKAATENAETAVLIGAGTEGIGFGRLVHSLLLQRFESFASATASKNASIIPRSFTPGALSTPDDTSIPVARVDAIASATLSLFSPPESM
ncbi:hypothetical protein D3C80_211340 [compost metagenome]